MALRLEGTISGCGRSAGAGIPALGPARYAPRSNILLPSRLEGYDPHCTINVFWGQPGALATVSIDQCSSSCFTLVKHWYNLCQGWREWQEKSRISMDTSYRESQVLSR